MRILHTADWHLGKRLDNFSRLEEQRAVLDEICRIADQQDAQVIIVAGDLFDTFNPPVEATELLYSTLKKLSNNGKRPVIAIAGNHDSPERIESPDALALECGILFAGYPDAILRPVSIPDGFTITKSDKGFAEISLPESGELLRVLITPYANEVRLKEYFGEEKQLSLHNTLQQVWKSTAEAYCDAKGVNLLVTHLYMAKRGENAPEEPEGEKPLRIGTADIVYSDAIPSEIQYTALGHLHRIQNTGTNERPALYTGSPLQYSFSEAGQQKYVCMLHAEPEKTVTVDKIPLSSGRTLHRKKFETVSDALLWLQKHPYTLVELTVKTEQYLSAEDIKQLHNAHDGIIYIIPLASADQTENMPNEQINLDQDITILFRDYFLSKHGQLPSQEITDLLSEVLKQDI